MKQTIMQRFYGTINNQPIENQQLYLICTNLLDKLEKQFSISIDDSKFTNDFISSIKELLHNQSIAPEQVKNQIDTSIELSESLDTLNFKSPIAEATEAWNNALKEGLYDFLKDLHQSHHQATSVMPNVNQSQQQTTYQPMDTVTMAPQPPVSAPIQQVHPQLVQQPIYHEVTPNASSLCDPFSSVFNDVLKMDTVSPYTNPYRMNPYGHISNPKETILSKAYALGASKQTADFLQSYIAHDKTVAYPIFEILDYISADIFQTVFIPYLQARHVAQIVSPFPTFTKDNYSSFTLNNELIRTVYFDKNMNLLSISIPEDIHIPNELNRNSIPYLRGALVSLYQEQMQLFAPPSTINPITMPSILPLQSLLIPTVFRRMIMNFLGREIPQRIPMVFDTNQIMVYPSGHPEFGLRAYTYFNGNSPIYSRTQQQETNDFLNGYIAGVLGLPQAIAQRVFLNSESALRNYNLTIAKATSSIKESNASIMTDNVATSDSSASTATTVVTNEKKESSVQPSAQANETVSTNTESNTDVKADSTNNGTTTETNESTSTETKDTAQTTAQPVVDTVDEGSPYEEDEDDSVDPDNL